MMFSVYLISVAHQEEITIFARRELSNLAYISHVWHETFKIGCQSHWFFSAYYLLIVLAPGFRMLFRVASYSINLYPEKSFRRITFIFLNFWYFHERSNMYIEIILIDCELKLIETDLSAVLCNRNSGSLHMEGEGRKGISERGGGLVSFSKQLLARLQEIRNLIIRCLLIRVQASFFVQIFIIIFFIIYVGCDFFGWSPFEN